MRRHTKTLLIFLAFLLSLLLSTSGILAQQRPEYKEGELLIKFKPRISSQASAISHGSLGSRVAKHFKRTGIQLVKLRASLTTREAIELYKKDPDVEYVEPNYKLHALDLFPDDPSFNDLWGLHNTGQTGGTPDADIDAPEAWQVNTGSDEVIVAVIDSGVDYNHEDLSANMWVNESELNGTHGEDDDGNGYVDDIYGIDAVNSDTDPIDDYGHGTHCSGTIGAVGDNGIGVVGVNWNVKIMTLKFLDSDGTGWTGDAIECLEYVVMMKQNYGHNIRITSNSWGGGDYSQALYNTIQAAENADILFVAATGNDFQNNDLYPNYPSTYDLPNIIAVAATDGTDDLAYFGFPMSPGSNWGPTTVDVAAPGKNVLSCIPGNHYGYKSGTSMATPHVSGLAALILAQHPTLSSDQVKCIILLNADPLPGLQGRILSGGRINANSALAWTPSSLDLVISRPPPQFGVLHNTENVISALVRTCGGPVEATVTVDFDNEEPSLTLHDNGVYPDLAATDGLYSGLWIPQVLGDVTLTVTASCVGYDPASGQVSGTVDHWVPQWAKTYGLGENEWVWSGEDMAYSIQQTSDGGYVVAGKSSSFSEDGNFDAWVLRLNSDGTVAWQKTYGGTSGDWAYSIQQTSDGGYVVAGGTRSSGAGSADFWVLRLNSDGTITWQKTYGGTSYDYAYSIQQTSDGGYVVAGYTYSFSTGDPDIWLLKLYSDGTVAWQKTYGGSNSDKTYSIQQTSDGGYVVAGATSSFGAGNYDFLILKLSSDGTTTWQKTYGGGDNDYAYSVQQTSDGGYVAAGATFSFGAGSADFWVLRLNSDGTVAWQKTYGGTSYDYAYSIQQTSDGGYILAGSTDSFGAGSHDLWALKLDPNGTVAWQKTYGGSGDDYADSIQQTSDGGYVVAGRTYSFGAGGHLGSDAWVLKLHRYGGITDCSAIGTSYAIVTNGADSGLNTSIIRQGTSVLPSETSVSPQDTWAEISGVCVTSVTLEANFTAHPTSGTKPLNVEFTDQSTGSITGWSWDFGDGETSTEQNPSHTYNTAGDFTVSLTVTGAGGDDSEVKEGYIHVSAPPPVITKRLPTALKRFEVLKIWGYNFGADQGDGVVRIGRYSQYESDLLEQGAALSGYLKWTDTVIKVKLRVSPAYQNKRRWIWVEKDGMKSNGKPIDILPD